MKITMDISKYCFNTMFIKSIKVAGAFICPKDSSRGRLWDVTLLNSKLMVTRSKVNLREITGTLELIEQVINPWDGIFTLDCDLVQLSMINAHVERIGAPHREILDLIKRLYKVCFDCSFYSLSSIRAICYAVIEMG